MTVTQDKRIWIAGGAVLAVLILAAGWLMFIGPTLSGAASLDSQAADQRGQNTSLAAEDARLMKLNDNIDSLRFDLRKALAALPYDSGAAAFTRQVNSQANASHVTIDSLTVKDATALTTAAATGTAASTGASGSTGRSSNGLVSIAVTIMTRGSFAAQLAFLHAVQFEGPRVALVGSTQFGPGSGSTTGSIDNSSALTTQLTLFAAPLTPAQIERLNKLLQSS